MLDRVPSQQHCMYAKRCMPDAYSWTQANVTACYFLKQCLSSAGRWLCGSSPQPTSQRASSLKELKIAFSFHCEIKQFSHTYAYVNAASVKQFWSLNTHTHRAVKASWQFCTRLSFSQVLSPKYRRLRTRSWHLVPCRSFRVSFAKRCLHQCAYLKWSLWASRLIILWVNKASE